MRGVDGLERFNRLPEEAAVAELLAVCHSRRWAERVAAGRPYPDLTALQAAADELWMELDPADWLEALGAHPRIGESGGRSAGWSRQEQAGVGGADADVRQRLAAGVHRLTFATGDWFLAQGLEGFYPEVTVVCRIADPGAHYHVPLLLSPYGYSTYRGS